MVTSTWKSRIFSSFSVFLLLVADLCLQSERFARNKCYDKTLWVDKSPRLVCLYSTKTRQHSSVYCIRRIPSYLVLCQIPEPSNPPTSGWAWLRRAERKCARVCVCVCARRHTSVPAASLWVSTPPLTPRQFQVGDWWESKFWRRVKDLRSSRVFWCNWWKFPSSKNK